MKTIATSLTLLLALTGCQKAPEPTGEFDAGFIEVGREIAETRCAICHNIDPTGTSRRADAPPLRTVLAGYSSEALADDFREHIHVGHPDMPDFNFTVKQTEGLLAYLYTIQETPASNE